MFKFCPNCGAKVIEGSKFCYDCGVSFEQLKQSMAKPEASNSEPVQPAEVVVEQKTIQPDSTREAVVTEASDDNKVIVVNDAKSSPEETVEPELAPELETEPAPVSEPESKPEPKLVAETADTVAINQNLPVPQEKDEVEEVNENLPVEESDRRYIISGEPIIIDDDLAHYTSIRRQFAILSFNALIKAADEYNETVKSFEDMVDGMEAIFIKHLRDSITLGRDILLKEGVLEYDISGLIKECGDDIDFRPYMQPLVKAINDLKHRVDALMEQRAMERSNRSEWVGGGFGISGAISGAVKAGILNMGTNALRGIGDAFTDSSDRRKIEEWKRAIYNNDEFRNKFLQGVYECCMNVFFTIDLILDLPFEGEYSKATAYFNNLRELYSNHAIETEEYRRKLIDVILEYPFEVKFYRELYMLNIFDYKTLRRLTDFMGLGSEFDNAVKSLAEGVLKAAHPDLNDDIEALKYKQKLLIEIKEQGFTNEANIDAVKEKLDKMLTVKKYLQLLPTVSDTAETFMDKQEELIVLKHNHSEINFDEYTSKEAEELIAEKYKLAAEAGYSLAQYFMAVTYSEYGSEDWFKWLTLAAEQDDEDAQNLLGIAYYEGQYSAKDIEKAKMWLEKAVEHDDNEARVYLGRIALEENEYEKAYDCFNTAYDNEYIGAASYLAECYLEGFGVEKNSEKAKELLKVAADQEDYLSLYKYALLLEPDAEPTEYENILNMFNTAFDQGIVDAGVSAGEFLEKLYQQNQDEDLMRTAARYYEAAVEKKCTKAALHLGSCYLDGKGVIQNDRLAFQYLYMAVEESPEAMNEVGVCYFNGVGIKKNYDKAFRFFVRSAKLGNTEALFNLGICFYYGLGTAEDKVRGVKLLKEAANRGHADAADLLTQLS